MAVDHYENFPVASLLLPAHLRSPVAAIYRFARNADDFADEGDRSAEQRLAMLAGYERELDAIEAGNTSEDPVFAHLRQAIAAHDLPIRHFRDLLDAFRQDVNRTRYDDFDDLMHYCRRSANPVGRLLLRLFRADSAANVELSDAICSSLQLVNHWQDVAVDWGKGRIYLPADEMHRYGVDEGTIARKECNGPWRQLMRFQVERARALMQAGVPLGRILPGRIGLEIRVIIAGGLRILEKIEAVGYDVFRRRPVLSATDWPRLLTRAL